MLHSAKVADGEHELRIFGHSAGLLAGAFVLATASRALGMPLFASPPHFVAGDARREIVLFLNESAAGAVAVRVADDAIDVIVPDSRVDATVQGEQFADADAQIRRVVLTSSAHGATTIRIETEGSAGDVSVRSVDEPPRLIVVLGAERDAAPAVAPAAPRPTAIAPTGTPMPTEAPTASATADPTAEATATASEAATPVPTSTPGAVGRGVRLGDALQAMSEPDAAVPMAVRSAPADRGGMPCLWRRWYRVPFCAPDPGAAAYATDPATAALAAMLATPGAGLPSLPAGEGAALEYLRADRTYIDAARSGRMLGAINAYRHALRRHPDFVDAARARLNIALAYRVMGFEGELRAVAEVAEGEVTGALLRALAGDVALEAGALERARVDYSAVATRGELGACLALRGHLAIALEGGEDVVPADALSALEQRCPRAVLEDPATQLLRARVRLEAGDLATARTLLNGLDERVPARGRARVIATRGAVAESAGDRAAARAAYEELVVGDYGTRAAQSASARLALLDAADGDIEGGLRRLTKLDASSGAGARRALVARALAELDEAESASRVIALVHEADVGPDELPVAGQIRLARAYRELGFHSRAADVMDRARTGAGPGAPPALWLELEQIARARGGWPAVSKIASAWLAEDPLSGQAAAMRVRAIAGVGQTGAVVEALASAATKLNASEMRDLRITVGNLLRRHDPMVAQRLLEEAAEADITPALPATRAAELLWELGDLAEANGDPTTARAMFAQLSRRYGTEPAAVLAAYRYGRLAESGESERAYDDAVASSAGLELRAAEAAREFEAVVATLAQKEAP